MAQLKIWMLTFMDTMDEIFGKIQDYPFDIRGLTGCLSFIDLTIENSKINSLNSSCEDAVNFININGKLVKLT